MNSSTHPFRGEILRSIRSGAPPTPTAIARLAEGHTATLGAEGRTTAVSALTNQLVGMGPLTPLAEDPAVTDLLVNGDGTVWVDRAGGAAPEADAVVRTPRDLLPILAAL